jgi:hypothetical protein
VLCEKSLDVFPEIVVSAVQIVFCILMVLNILNVFCRVCHVCLQSFSASALQLRHGPIRWMSDRPEDQSRDHNWHGEP